MHLKLKNKADNLYRPNNTFTPQLSLEAQFCCLYDTTPPGRHPVLPIGGTSLLSPYVHTSTGRILLSLPGEDVQFVRGSIFASQIQQHRPSYINALLIQSRGVVLAQPCTNCRHGQGMKPFPECRHVPGAFGGACANCKWPDWASQCSVRDEYWQGVEDHGNLVGSSERQGQPVHHTGHPGSMVSEPINLDPEEGDSGNPIDLDREGGESNAIVLYEEGTSEDPISL